MKIQIPNPEREGNLTFQYILENHCEVVIHQPAVVLKFGKQTFVAKNHNEEFDPEKGLLMCIAKLVGLKHCTIRHLLTNAKVIPPNK